MESNSTDNLITENKVNETSWDKISRNLKSALAIAITTGAGGYYQWQVEVSKVLNPSLEPGKFPNGMADFNLKEELSEGALFSASGAILGLIAYRYICNKRGIHPEAQGEIESIILGSTLSYGFMAFAVGPVLHHLSGTNDFKWGPFK